MPRVTKVEPGGLIVRPTGVYTQTYTVADLFVSPPRIATPSAVALEDHKDKPRSNSADFDSLIDLITSAIAPAKWDKFGGRGSIAPFDTNLSLVVSQTQKVHEEIVDLLEQLRRLQDLQIRVDAEIVRVPRKMLERIGIELAPKTEHTTLQP